MSNHRLLKKITDEKLRNGIIEIFCEKFGGLIEELKSDDEDYTKQYIAMNILEILLGIEDKLSKRALLCVEQLDDLIMDAIAEFTFTRELVKNGVKVNVIK